MAVSALTAWGNVDLLIAQAAEHRPRLAVIGCRELYPRLRDALEPLGIETAWGRDALCRAAVLPGTDMVVTATVGFAGLPATLAAIDAGIDIALANKETLVVAGELIKKHLEQSPSRIYPVDSEHSAIAQCLEGEDAHRVGKLYITASGGPFVDWDSDRIYNATAAMALKHPNWSMGRKITVDSATMMNKAFEIIEARWLFDIPARSIVPLVHRQSIVHSMVEFDDGAVKAQLGVPDMHLPIAYALGRGTRLRLASQPLSLTRLSHLTFEEPRRDVFKCLDFAGVALERGGNTACVINAANEVAVQAFLDDKIKFGQIFETVHETLQRVDYAQPRDLQDYLECNEAARSTARQQTIG